MIRCAKLLILSSFVTVVAGCAVSPTKSSAPVITGSTEMSSTATAPTVETPSTTASMGTEPSLSPEGPKINWDAPLPEGKMSSVDGAVRDGALTFIPTPPSFSMAPVAVQVSDPSLIATDDRAVVYIYRFETGPDFPTDGRVRVLEYATTSSETELEGVAKNPPGPAEDFSVISIAGHSALLVQGDGVGRVQFIREGVMFDVTGPAVPIAFAEKLAAQL